MIKRMIKDRSTESDAKATWPALPPACLPRSWNASVEGNGTMRA